MDETALQGGGGSAHVLRELLPHSHLSHWLPPSLPLTPSDSSNPLPPSLCHSTAVTQDFAQLCAVVLDTDPCTAFASWEVSAKCGEPENYCGTAVCFSTVHCNALSLLHCRGQMLRSIRVAAAGVYRVHFWTVHFWQSGLKQQIWSW